MTDRYQKTEAGRDEIRARVRALTRPARNLLVIVDPTRTGREWLALVAGTSAVDLQALLEAGLIERARAAAPAAGPADPALVFAQALERLDYSTLYAHLTATVRPRLGLVKGFKAVLEIERSSDVQALRELAIRLVADVRAAQGEAGAQQFMRDLASER